MSAETDRIAGISGHLAVKAPVAAATTANITLSGEQAIDGVAIVADDRVLVKDQTDGSENGIYNASATAWTRAKDFNGARDVVSGTQVFDNNGSNYYVISTADPITIDTTSISFLLTGPTDSGSVIYNPPAFSVISRTVEEKLAEIVSPLDAGAKGDLRTITGLSITSGTASLAASPAQFLLSDVGKSIVVVGAGVAGAWLIATITTFVTSSSVLLSTNASTTVSSAAASLGTDDSAAINSTLAYWVDQDNSKIVIPSLHYLCLSALAATFTDNDSSNKTLDMGGARISSAVTSGSFLTVTAEAYLKNFHWNGGTIFGGGGETNLVHLDGGEGPALESIYSAIITGLHLHNFTTNGFLVENDFFESRFAGCSARTSTIVGVGMAFQDGAYGTISSITLDSCNTSGGDIGVNVASPVAGVTVFNPTCILAQKEGMKLNNQQGTSVFGGWFENNWEGEASIATGGAGLKVTGFGDIIGVGGTTARNQRYIVETYVGSDQVFNVMGGRKAGSVVEYLNIDGVASPNAGEVNMFSKQTVNFTQNDVRLNRVGEDGIQLGDGATNNQGKVSFKSDGGGFEGMFHKWTGSGDNYYAWRIIEATSTTWDIQASPSAAIGAESWTTVFSISKDAELGFFGATPISKPAITGALSSVTDANAKAVLTAIVAALEAGAGLGLVTDSTT